MRGNHLRLGEDPPETHQRTGLTRLENGVWGGDAKLLRTKDTKDKRHPGIECGASLGNHGAVSGQQYTLS